MKQHFPTNRFRNRPWLLLWLLPFVLLNVAGEALHNHPIFPVAHAVSHGALSGHWQHADAPHSQSRENAHLDVACLVCQWHAFSVGNLDAAGAFVAPLSASRSRVLATLSLRTRAAAAPSNRGPPLSFA